MIANHYDVIVIGGGPAGSTTAALVAEYGHRVLLLEREEFPRFQIGESLMPGTYWSFKRLGLLDKLKKSAFVKNTVFNFLADREKVRRHFIFTYTIHTKVPLRIRCCAANLIL